MALTISKVKIERWRITLWKDVIREQKKVSLLDEENPGNREVKAYSDGVNAGLMIALGWYEKYVEGKT